AQPHVSSLALHDALPISRLLVDDRVKLPYGTRLEWGGEMDELESTAERLAIIVPITLFVIGALVFSAVRGWGDMGIVLLGVPLADRKSTRLNSSHVWISF